MARSIHDEESYDKKITELAEDAGVAEILAIDGVWDLVVAHFHDRAVDLLNEEQDEADMANGELS